MTVFLYLGPADLAEAFGVVLFRAVAGQIILATA